MHFTEFSTGFGPQYGCEQDSTHSAIRSKAENGAGLALRRPSSSIFQHDLPAGGVHKGSEGEEDLEIRGEDPLKQ